MPISAAWDDDDKIVMVVRFDGRWTLDEFAQGVSDVERMLASVSHPVYLLADGSTGQGMPARGNLIPYLRHFFNLNVAHIAVITGTSFGRTMVNMLVSLNPQWQQRVTFVADRAAAEMLLREKQEEAQSSE